MDKRQMRAWLTSCHETCSLLDAERKSSAARRLSEPASALTVLALVALALQSAGIWHFTVDDSYISFRYGYNLANFGSPTWNPGRPPVEGYTSFSWVVITAIPHLLGLDVVVFAKIFGLAATIGTMICVYLLVVEGGRMARSGVVKLAAAHAVLLLALFAPSATHAVSGMETALYTLLIAALGLAILRAVAGSRRAIWTAALLALLMGITRPEGNLVALVALGVGAAYAHSERRGEILKAILLCYILPGITYFITRALYYDVPMPLPFYIKVASQPISGLSEVYRFGLYLAMAAGPLMIAGLFYLRRGMLPTVLSAAALIVFFIVPAHIMGYGWRFLYPAAPAMIAVGGIGLAALADLLLRDTRKQRVRYGIILLAALMAGSAAMMARGIPESIAEGRRTSAAMERAHLPLGRLLARIDQPEDRVLAIGDAGAIPYYSRWRTIDTFGLNDPVIAVSGQHDPSYVLDQEPDLLVLISASPEEFRPHLEWEADLLREAYARNLQHIATMTYLPGSYYLWLLAEPDSEVAELIMRYSPTTMKSEMQPPGGHQPWETWSTAPRP